MGLAGSKFPKEMDFNVPRSHQEYQHAFGSDAQTALDRLAQVNNACSVGFRRRQPTPQVGFAPKTYLRVKALADPTGSDAEIHRAECEHSAVTADVRFHAVVDKSPTPKGTVRLLGT